jgi:hypothetical protein
MHHITGNTSSAPFIGQLIVCLLVNSTIPGPFIGQVRIIVLVSSGFSYWSAPDPPIGQHRILLILRSGSSYWSARSSFLSSLGLPALQSWFQTTP